MATPLGDLVGVFRRIFRFLRYAGFLLLALTLTVLVREVVAWKAAVDRVDPVLGWVFVGLVVLLAIRLLGVPVYRFFRMPVVLEPPELPEGDQAWTEKDVVARQEFLTCYLSGLKRNPELAARRAEIRSTLEDLAELSGRISGAEDPKAARTELAKFEAERVNAILLPLDQQVDRLIRAEALSVGVATAVSPNGTLDAFVVLWRNANLVSRIANFYYGKPGVRGSLRILRDVSGAAVLATYLEGISEAAGGVLMGILGSFAGVIAGPVVDGSVNAITTLRIGYLAKARCRSFKAWTPATKKQAILSALGAAKNASRDVLAGIARAAGASVSGVTGKIGDAMKSGVSALLTRLRGEEDAGPAPAGS